MSLQTAVLFVGERRSPTAIRRGLTWEDGRLCAKTLHEALDALGISSELRLFVNAFTDEGAPDPHALRMAQIHVKAGGLVVGLGQKAQARLAAAEIPHIKLVHPAARGTIRRTETYRAHVAAVMAGVV